MKIDDTDIKLLTETEIRFRYITPAIKEVVGWDWVQIGKEIMLGKIIVWRKVVVSAEVLRVRAMGAVVASM